MSSGVDNFGVHYTWLLRGTQQHRTPVAHSGGELNETPQMDSPSLFSSSQSPLLFSRKLTKINYLHWAPGGSVS